MARSPRLLLFSIRSGAGRKSSASPARCLCMMHVKSVTNDPIGTVVVGYGYWGPNIVRNVIERPEFELIALCERDQAPDRRVREANSRHPLRARASRKRSPTRDVEAVAIATPPHTHYIAGAPGAGSRQAGAGREAARPDRRRGGRAGRPLRRGRPGADARPHLPLQPLGQQGQRADRRRRPRRDLLRHLLADEPRPLPARRGRPRPRPARPLDPPLLARQTAGRGDAPTAAASSRTASTRPPS